MEGDSQSSPWRRPILEWRSQTQTSNYYQWKSSWVPRQWSLLWPKTRRLLPRDSPLVWIQGSLQDHRALSSTLKPQLRKRWSHRLLNKSRSLTLQSHQVSKKHHWCKLRKSSSCRSSSHHNLTTCQLKRRKKKRKKRRSHWEWSSKSTLSRRSWLKTKFYWLRKEPSDPVARLLRSASQLASSLRLCCRWRIREREISIHSTRRITSQSTRLRRRQTVIPRLYWAHQP